MSESLKGDPGSVRTDLGVLCRDIGERVGGTEGERRGLEYMRSRLGAMGLRRPRIESFEFDDCEFGDYRGEAHVGRRKRKLSVRPCEYATSTPRGGVEGELVFMDSAGRAGYGGPELEGKVGLFMGAPMPDPEYLACMCDSGLAAAILVDNRYFSRWPVSLGFPEMWAKQVRAPLFSLPYDQAWRLARSRGPVRVRLWLKAKRKRSRSGNAIADLPGADPRLRSELIYVSGHMDSVRGSVGASDNASGIVFALEVARALRERPLRRSVRFIGYGVEEKLSVGSFRHFQRRARNGMNRAVFGYNGDACGSSLGVTGLLVTGPPGLTRLTRRMGAKLGYTAQVSEGVCPFSDQFALNMMKRPTVWVMRRTHTSGIWFFHSAHDNLAAVDERLIARDAAFAAEFLRRIDSGERLPFPVSVPAAQWREVKENAGQLYGVELKGRP